MKKILISLAMLIAATSFAQKRDYLQPLAPTVRINDQAGQSLGNAGYPTTSGKPFWSFNQWLNPNNLIPQQFPNGTTWELANATSRLKFYPYLNGRTNVYELASANIPCINTAENGIPLELDLFLETTDDFYSAPLGNMAQLKMAANIQGTHSELQGGCNFNNSSYVASLILNSSSGQILFVQIEAGGNNPPPTAIWCPDFEIADANSIMANRFCLNDSISHYGGNFIQGIGGGYFSIDILPRLLQIIQSNHKKSGVTQRLLDPNPNNWRITKFYMGTVNQGKVVTTTQWSDIELQSVEGTYCYANKKVQFICEPPVSQNGWAAQPDGCYQKLTTIPCQ